MFKAVLKIRVLKFNLYRNKKARENCKKQFLPGFCPSVTQQSCEFSLGPGQRRCCGTLENISDMQLLCIVQALAKYFNQLVRLLPDEELKT